MPYLFFLLFSSLLSEKSSERMCAREGAGVEVSAQEREEPRVWTWHASPCWTCSAQGRLWRVWALGLGCCRSTLGFQTN